MQLNSNIARKFPYYQTGLLSSALPQLDEDILLIIGMHQPVMAKHIAAQLSIKHKHTYSRRDINSRLFKSLTNFLIQDEYFRWSLRYEGTEHPGQEEDPEKENYIEDWDAVNLDSTTRIKYSNGEELTIKFTKLPNLKSNGPQADVTYVYYKSPLAYAILTKKIGDICYLPGGQCKVLKIN